MASINVRPEFYAPVESSNKQAVSGIIQQVRAITSNLSSGNLSGDVIFDLTTGAGQYLDLFKSHLCVNYTTSAITAFAGLDMLAMACWDRSQCFINGTKVANSNHYTQDSALSKRLNFSRTYNESVNQMRFVGPTAAVTFPAAGVNCSCEFLDGLFIRTGSCILPPNTNLRIILSSAASNGLYKSCLGDGADTAITLAINDLYFNAYYVNEASPPPSEYILKFITMDSFKQGISGTTLNQQYNSRKNLVRLAATFQSTAAEATDLTAATKIYNATQFAYLTDASTTKCNTLIFKAGSQNLPNKAYDNTYGFYELYLAYINNSEGILDSSAKETYADWLKQGMIYTVPVIKSIAEDIRNVEVNATFASAPAANAFFTLFYEQYVTMMFGPQGQSLETLAAI